MSRTTLSVPTPITSDSPGRARTPLLATRRAALLAALAVPLAACTAGGSSAGSASDGGASASDAGGARAQVTVTDPWAKAAAEGMSAVFGTLTNTGDAAITLVAAATSAAAEVQLHETTADGSGGMSMSEKEGGFPIPAGGTLVLEPGGDHIMLMDLTAPLEPGAEITVTLTFAGGGELTLTAPVKDFAGAQEDYGSDAGGDDGMDGMDHGSMSSDGGGE